MVNCATLHQKTQHVHLDYRKPQVGIAYAMVYN